MLDSVLARMQASGGITETSPGSIARMFAEVIIEEFSPLYDELDLSAAMSLVSSASGAYLDLVAELVNCIRNTDETDDNFRARISNQVYVVQSANIISLRLRALQIDGVADVQFKRFTQGTGSFTCYVTPQVFPIDNNVLLSVEGVLEEAAAYGMGVGVKVSDYKPVDMTINLIFQSKSTTMEREFIRNQVVTGVTNYMSGLNMGASIIINEIVQRVMDISDQILDLEIKEISISDKQYFIKNIEPSMEERYYLRKISVM